MVQYVSWYRLSVTRLLLWLSYQWEVHLHDPVEVEKFNQHRLKKLFLLFFVRYLVGDATFVVRIDWHTSWRFDCPISSIYCGNTNDVRGKLQKLIPSVFFSNDKKTGKCTQSHSSLVAFTWLLFMDFISSLASMVQLFYRDICWRGAPHQ